MSFDQHEQSGLVSAKLVVDLVCYFSIPLLLFFGATSYSHGHTAYGLSLFGVATAALASFMVYKFFGRWRLHRNFLTTLFTGFYFYILITGGEENSGILWLYAYPLLIFTILGMHFGTLALTAILTATTCILFIPGWLGIELPYSDNTKSRFIGSMFFVTIMAYIMERARVSAAHAHARVSEALEDLARTDELTGLLNRRGISERVDTEFARSEREGGEMSIMICDVDHFKKINDSYGHDIGDQVLVQLAERLKQTLRGSDSVGRWGGEEFIVLLPNTDIQQAYLLIERVRKAVAETPFQCSPCELDVSISCGLASTKFSSELGGLLKAADMSLYEAKRQGRNRTHPKFLEAS